MENSKNHAQKRCTTTAADDALGWLEQQQQ